MKILVGDTFLAKSSSHDCPYPWELVGSSWSLCRLNMFSPGLWKTWEQSCSPLAVAGIRLWRPKMIYRAQFWGKQKDCAIIQC